jgi:hypothetical protein
MDLLFGTYVCPDHEPESFGLNEPTPRTYLGYLIAPFLPKRRARHRESDVVKLPPVNDHTTPDRTLIATT